jgi:hypothetical protein
MFIVIYGVLLFFIAFFIHLLIWRIHLPKNHTKVLLIIFLEVLLVGIFLLFNLQKFNLFEYLQLCFLFISMALAYITTYSGIEVQSPSLKIVLKIAEAGTNGLNRGALYSAFTDNLLVEPRIKDLAKDKMIYLDSNKFKLLAKGVLLARLFIFYRKLLNAGKGG